MEFLQAFPIAIIDEDYEGKHAAGRGMRQLAAAIEKEGFRVVAGLSYEDARRLVNVFNTESCWLVSVDGAEASADAMADPGGSAGRQAPPQRPAADLSVRRRAHRGDGAGKRAQARERLHAPVRGLARVPRARDCALGAALPRAPAAADVQGADGLHAARELLLAHARPRRRRRPSARARSAQLFYQFFGENTLRSDISVSVGQLGSLLDHTGPIAEGERNAARIFGADETLFVVGGTSTSNKIVWHGMVGTRRPRAVRPQLPQVDPALADHDRGDADLSRPVAQRPRASSGRSRAISSRPSRSSRRSPPARSRRKRAARCV